MFSDLASPDEFGLRPKKEAGKPRKKIRFRIVSGCLAFFFFFFLFLFFRVGTLDVFGRFWTFWTSVDVKVGSRNPDLALSKNVGGWVDTEKNRTVI